MLENRLALEDNVSGGVECVLCAPYFVSLHHREAGFSWFLNAMPAENTPKEKLWEILYVLHFGNISSSLSS